MCDNVRVPLVTFLAGGSPLLVLARCNLFRSLVDRVSAGSSNCVVLISPFCAERVRRSLCVCDVPGPSGISMGPLLFEERET